MTNLTYKNGIKDGIPIALGYFAVSLAFGVTATSLGVPYYISILISISNLTSAGQLAGVAIVAVLGTVLEIILTQLVINARYFLMSLTLSQKLDNKFKMLDRFLCAFGITDEIFAVAVSKKEVSKNYMYGLMLLPIVGWTLGTTVGAILGNVLPQIIVNALSIALFAMFISIVCSASLDNKKIFPVILISAVLSCCFYFIPYLSTISSGIAYIFCALISAVIGAILFPIEVVDSDE